MATAADDLKRSLGWDERDYRLWSEIYVLPSFGLIASNDRMISLAQVRTLLEKHAEARFSLRASLAPAGEGEKGGNHG